MYNIYKKKTIPTVCNYFSEQGTISDDPFLPVHHKCSDDDTKYKGAVTVKDSETGESFLKAVLSKGQLNQITKKNEDLGSQAF